MQKRNLALGALAILVLLGVYLALRRTQQPRARASTSAQTSFEIPQLKTLEEIAIMPSASPRPLDDGSLSVDSRPAPERIVLARRQTHWWVEEPIKGPLQISASRELDALFSKPIRADDFVAPASEQDALLLSKSLATRIALYTAASQDEEALSFLLGKRTMAPGTQVARTFVRKDLRSPMVRARADLSILDVRRPEALRSTHAILQTHIIPTTFSYVSADGRRLEFEQTEQGWALQGSELALEQNHVQQVAGLLAGLPSVRIIDDISQPGRYGLGEGAVRIEAHHVKLSVGKVGERYFVKQDDWPLVHEVERARGEQLYRMRRDFESLVMRPLDAAQIARVVLPGEGSAALTRRENDWLVVQRERLLEANQERAQALITRIAHIKGAQRVDPQPELQGLGPGSSARLLITMKDGSVHELWFGAPGGQEEAGEGAPMLYARFADEPERVFLLPAALLTQLSVPAEELTAP